MADFAVGIGSNLGDRMHNIQEGVRFLLSRSMMGYFQLSGVYETPPLEDVEGGDFLNCAMTGSFFGSADDLLGNCREAEVLMGSSISKNGGSRTLDMDLLFFGETERNDDDLVLPHSRITSRKFVLKPLSEIWKEKVPVIGKTPMQLLRKCTDDSRIKKVHPMPPRGCFWEVPS